MSYDRVLPKPPALHYDSQVTLSRPTSNLLEHKIMNDDLTKMSVMDHRRDAPPVGASCRYVADALPQVHLSSLNRAKIALNKIASTAPIEPPRSTEPGLTPQLPLRERSSVSERSSSASPTKRESETKFCLCQPDPKIPRPRNGKLSKSPPHGVLPTSNIRFTAFILYRQHYQAAVVASNPGLANPEVSKIIGIQWRSLPQDTKDEWKKLAEVAQPQIPRRFHGLCQRLILTRLKKPAINSNIRNTGISRAVMDEMAALEARVRGSATTPTARVSVAGVVAE